MISKHDWVIDVLTDLRAYAEAHDMPRLADSAAATLAIAREEIAQTRPDDDSGTASGPAGTD